MFASASLRFNKKTTIRLPLTVLNDISRPVRVQKGEEARESSGLGKEDYHILEQVQGPSFVWI